MNRMLFSRLGFLVVLAGVGLASGCGGKKSASLAPVTGKVTVNGAPLTGGGVSLMADLPPGNPGAEEASKLAPAGLSGGEIKPDGTYKIYTDGKEGAPLGKYKVRVVPPITVPKDSKDTQGAPDIGFNPKFTDPNNTPLKYEVVATPEPGRYDLKLTK